MKLLSKIKKTLLDILGDIKVYRYPMFIVYDPTTFKVKGYHTRQAMDVLEPGDIVLRGYDCYLDGFFIPGEYSHGSIYAGNGQIIHAISEDVCRIDVIDFLRCDRFCILRQSNKELAEKAVVIAESLVGKHYDFDFIDGNDDYYCHELVVASYPDIQIDKKEVRILGIRLEPRYTCDSFLQNGSFSTVLEVKP